MLQLFLRSDAHSWCLPRGAATTACFPAWPPTQIGEPICLSCAGIPGRLHLSTAAEPKAISTVAEPVPGAPFATI